MAGKQMASIRLEEMTREQLETMKNEYGYTQTALIQFAVNYLYTETLKRKGEKEDNMFLLNRGVDFIADLIKFNKN